MRLSSPVGYVKYKFGGGVIKKSNQVILRPVFNRPEMLYLSLEYEEIAREYYNFPSNLITIFVVECGSPQKTLDLINGYKYPKKIIQRTEQYGLSKNILQGMKEAFKISDDYIIYIEDDILIHKTYFQYMDILLSLFSKNEYSIFSPYNGDDIGEVNEIYKGHHYAALAPLINKDFFKNYIEPCINDYFYRNFTTRSNFVVALNKKYKKYWGKEYKYTNEAHNQQAGLINRLVDVALIEEDRHVITPYVNRQQHIGYGFSLNRPGGALPGIFFDERLRNLREIIKSAEKMYSMTAAKQYNDYKIFSNKLKEWDGTLRLNR